jgi:flagellar hook-basal body complex protein FliE
MLDAIRLPLIRPTLVETPPPAFMGNVAPSAAPGTQPSDFTAMLASMAGEAVSTVKTAESASIAAIHGKASIQQVAEAVLAAELTLQSAIAVRDKVTAAYLELSRMAI